MNPTLLVTLLAVVIAFTSCDLNRVYEMNTSVAERTWKVEDRFKFAFEIQDTLSSYNLFFNLRNDNSYPYSNLYVYSWFSQPNGQVKKDTMQFVLAYPDGRWIGSSSGDLVNNQILFARKVEFQQSGTYVFEFEQGMRTANLIGISDVGLRIEKAE